MIPLTAAQIDEAVDQFETVTGLDTTEMTKIRRATQLMPPDMFGMVLKLDEIGVHCNCIFTYIQAIIHYISGRWYVEVPELQRTLEITNPSTTVFHFYEEEHHYQFNTLGLDVVFETNIEGCIGLGDAWWLTHEN